ncbi:MULTISPECIES: hypothetical protein [unclassified Amycolatopsis]|uniref:hypothetical protein n=1 Tax=unclassified Amycolatopsis TaxID=2618356 RepID=UPI002E13359D|nr:MULTISPECIES: hypothetical protein [unclassified Amycolatopsis]WSJ73722.1 hypothetical protein OG439_30155 [Amycolatopsis sp. NBC_01307]WSK82620.1 hypothetical protein OG570_19495 [Amycolatopsis sp. NBC_01286]
MRSAVRKFAVVAGVVVAATLVAVPGAEAAPVTTCPGTELHKEGLPKPLKNQLGEQAGTLRLWYSSANGGTNCAKVYDDASGSHSMSVSIRTDTSATVTDSGTFSTFAGGVVVTGTNGHCIYVSGSLSLGTGQVNQFRASAGPVACG